MNHIMDKLSPRIKGIVVTCAELVWFNSLWASTVLLGDSIAWLCWLLLIGRALVAADRFNSALLAGKIASVGIAFDMLLTINGWMVFDSDFSLILPHWMFALWLGFGYLLPNGLSYTLRLSPLVYAPLYAIVGAFNYWIAYKLGAVSWSYSVPLTLFALGCVWATLSLLWGMSRSLAVQEN